MAPRDEECSAKTEMELAMDEITARRLLGNLIGGEGTAGIGARGNSRIPAFAKIDESAIRNLNLASRNSFPTAKAVKILASAPSHAGGLAGLIGGTQGAAEDLSRASNGIFAGAAAGPIVGAPGAFGGLAAFGGDAAGAQRSGANNRSNKKSSSNPKLCPDDIERLDAYAEPSQISVIVDSAVVQTKFSEFLIGLSGSNVNKDTRYVYSDRGWIDLRHVVSAAFNAFADLGLSEEGGIMIEIIQFPRYPGSSFRGEDLRSNSIGQRAARIQHRSRFEKSFGESVVEALSRYTLYTESRAEDVLIRKNPC